MLTIESYFEMLKEEEAKDHLIVALSERLDISDAENWIKTIEQYIGNQSIQQFASYWNEYCDDYKSKSVDKLKKYMNIFSLLENVFRNVLLRPYVPAYRTINMDYAQCDCIKTKHVEALFLELGFKKNENLLTYEENNYRKTLIYAYMCSAFWYFLSLELLTRQPQRN